MAGLGNWARFKTPLRVGVVNTATKIGREIFCDSIHQKQKLIF